jgi:hypothetical protein
MRLSPLIHTDDADQTGKSHRMRKIFETLGRVKSRQLSECDLVVCAGTGQFGSGIISGWPDRKLVWLPTSPFGDSFRVANNASGICVVPATLLLQPVMTARCRASTDSRTQISGPWGRTKSQLAQNGIQGCGLPIECLTLKGSLG